jgi:hypothetical protein
MRWDHGRRLAIWTKREVEIQESKPWPESKRGETAAEGALEREKNGQSEEEQFVGPEIGNRAWLEGR